VLIISIKVIILFYSVLDTKLDSTPEKERNKLSRENSKDKSINIFPSTSNNNNNIKLNLLDAEAKNKIKAKLMTITSKNENQNSNSKPIINSKAIVALEENQEKSSKTSSKKFVNLNSKNSMKSNENLFNKKFINTSSRVSNALNKYDSGNPKFKTTVIKKIDVGKSKKLSENEFLKIMGATTKNDVAKFKKLFAKEKTENVEYSPQNLGARQRRFSNYDIKSISQSPFPLNTRIPSLSPDYQVQKRNKTYFKHFEMKTNNYKNFPDREPRISPQHSETKIKVNDPKFKITFRNMLEKTKLNDSNKRFLPPLANVSPIELTTLEKNIMKKSLSKPRLFHKKLEPL